MELRVAVSGLCHHREDQVLIYSLGPRESIMCEFLAQGIRSVLIS
jgi:hypothetical protein